jgi:hypothetical protein
MYPGLVGVDHDIHHRHLRPASSLSDRSVEDKFAGSFETRSWQRRCILDIRPCNLACVSLIDISPSCMFGFSSDPWRFETNTRFSYSFSTSQQLNRFVGLNFHTNALFMASLADQEPGP